ncbi:MAG: hypothetical protein SF187_25575 [Deltaproteobacteria bacterium]|nr:hypothetical protein [Deltaproteobacteria bacterium]
MAAALLGTSACEDQAIGRTCKVLASTTETSGVFNDQALECPTRLCIQPSYDQGVVNSGTSAFCTAECSKNSDCDEAETRDKNNTNDKRCTQGFACAQPFVVGPLACKKMCVCKDFVKVDAKGKAPVPKACEAL